MSDAPKHPAPWKWVTVDPFDPDRRGTTSGLLALVDGHGYKIAEADAARLSGDGREWLSFPHSPAKELIASAPEMAAMLRRHQWSGLAEHGQFDCCPECRAFGPYDLADDVADTYPGKTFGVHVPDCALAALLVGIYGAK